MRTSTLAISLEREVRKRGDLTRRDSMPIGSKRWGGEPKKMVEEARRNETNLGRARVAESGEERKGKAR